MAKQAKDQQVIAMQADVQITADLGEDGQPKSPPRFEMEAYTGADIVVEGFDLPVVVDLAGAKFHRSVKANLNHNRTEIVGHIDTKENDGKSIHLGGFISGGGAAAEQVLKAHKNGYPWEASIQANKLKLETLAKGKKATVNGREFTGPKYIARESNVYAVAFCDQGADDSTSVTIAASAASTKGKVMKAEVEAWVKQMLPSVDIEALSAEEITNLEASYEGQQTATKPKKRTRITEKLEEREVEAARAEAVMDYADALVDKRKYDREYIAAIKELADQAIEAKWTVERFRMEALEASIPMAHTVPAVRDRRGGVTERVLEAAICRSGRLQGLEDQFDDQTLSLADKHFKNGIGLKQLYCMAAEANGMKVSSFEVTPDVMRAGFGEGRHIHATQFSTISLPNVFSNTSNKFIREGWMFVDQTPLRLASVRSVRNFQTITTISLTGDMKFEEVASDGEIKHGAISEETYTNRVKTHAKMFAISRQDLINDDLGALTQVPRRLGRGSMLQLNHIFWTEFLNNSTFFTTARGNLDEGADTVFSLTSLALAEALFMNQTDPNGLPIGVMPAILLVPPAYKVLAQSIMADQLLINGGTNTTITNGNPWRGRFRVESSPYMANSTYTGASALKWYLLADPNDMPVIEIAALNGRVEPTVETADADFNNLGVQMRGYVDIGVAKQEYRGGVAMKGEV